MAATTTMVHVRVDENVKAQAAETLASMGLTVSDAIRVFLTRVVADKELPFALKAPNATSRVAIAEANEIIKSRRARGSAGQCAGSPPGEDRSWGPAFAAPVPQDRPVPADAARCSAKTNRSLRGA